MLGLKIGLNRLVAFDPTWASAFEAERDRLAVALDGLARGIEHYGSTAVAGLKAKPIIDILAGIEPFSQWDRCSAPLGRLGYELFVDAGVDGHHVFSRGNTPADRTHLLHLVAFGSAHWRRNLAFRDCLRRDAALRARYEAEKEAAAAAAPGDRLAYNALKSSFIQSVMAELPED